jgi:putative Holliday junction resolvase
MPEAGSRRPPQIVLAFDFGLRRIGVACGNTVSGTAAPLTTLLAQDGVPDWTQLLRVVKDQGATQLVVGRPYNTDSTESALSAASDRFAAELTTRCQQPVARVDERYSSLEAEAQLRAARQDGTRRRTVDKSDIDSHAAATILARWLAGEGQQN